MYTQDTILTLKEPRTQGTPAVGTPGEDGYEPPSEDYKPFPYDEVRVIGPSPVDHGAAANSQWSGSGAQGVIIGPLTEFGANLDEPLGKLQALYDVKEVPERVREAPKVRILESTSTDDIGPTPEDVFAKEAPGEASKNGERVRTPHVESPLEDPREKEAAGPLGAVEGSAA